MGVAYVKINQISGIKIDKSARYELSATLSSDNSIVSPVLFQIKKDDINLYLASDNIWMLPYEANSKDDSISITILEGKKKYEKIAKLILPLKWYPPDTVVHESYPMHHFEDNEKKKRSIFADVVVHLSTKGTDPFHAPPGQLLVRPMWVNKNVQQQPQAVGYIPGQCRPPQFIQPQPYGPYAYNTPTYQRMQPPIGIPQIRAGPAPQIFTQQLAPAPYQGYMNVPQQQPVQQPQQFNQQPQQQLQRPQQHMQPLEPQHKIQKPSNKETSSSDDGLENLGGDQISGTNYSAKPNNAGNTKFDLQPEDYVTIMPVTNPSGQTYNPNSK